MYEKLLFCAKYLRPPINKYVFFVNIVFRVLVQWKFDFSWKKSGKRRILEISFFIIFVHQNRNSFRITYPIPLSFEAVKPIRNQAV